MGMKKTELGSFEDLRDEQDFREDCVDALDDTYKVFVKAERDLDVKRVGGWYGEQNEDVVLEMMDTYEWCSDQLLTCMSEMDEIKKALKDFTDINGDKLR